MGVQIFKKAFKLLGRKDALIGLGNELMQVISVVYFEPQMSMIGDFSNMILNSTDMIEDF